MSSAPEAIVTKHKDQSQQSIVAFKRDLQKIRTGRASASLLEGIMVDYYGSKTQLTHLAQITAPEPRMIVVQVYDGSAVQSVEKAIHSAGLGFNPMREGNILRVSVPVLTEESRKEIVKHLNKQAEEIRVSIRNHRRDANDELKKLEKDSIITKDDSKRCQDKVQKQTDQFVEEVEKLLKAKEAECMEV